MTFLRAIGLICLLAGPLQAAPGSATFTKLGLHIEAHLNHETLYHGYTSHRFTIHHSGTGKRQIKFTLPGTPNHEDYSLHTITRSFTITPGTRDITLLQPPLPMTWSDDVLVECNGQQRTIERGLSRRLTEYENTGWQRPRVMLLSRRVDYDALNDTLSRTATSHAHSHSSTDLAQLESSAEATSAWPDHWLAYSGYDMILLTGNEWTQTSNDTRTALQRWTMAGGRLVVFGETQINPVPISWRNTRSNNAHPVGFGWIHLFGSENEPARDAIITLLGPHDPEAHQQAIPMLGALKNNIMHVHSGMHYWQNDQSFNDFFPVVDGARAPVRLVIGVLTLFVLLAGPINLFILNRNGKRAWFLWTLPAISMATSGLVFVVSIFSEGVTPRVRTESVTILNQAAGDAVTLGAVAVYAPIAPGQLNFSGLSEVTPLFSSGARDPGSGRSVAWTEGGEQVFTGQWASSRVPTHFAIRKSEHTKKRILINWARGKPEIQNSLGEPLRRLTLRNSAGELFEGKDILPGAKVTLEPSSTIAHTNISIHDFADQLRNQSADNHWQHLAISSIPTATYWAVVDHGSPFLENPLAYRSTKEQTLSHVIGILTEEEDAP